MDTATHGLAAALLPPPGPVNRGRQASETASDPSAAAPDLFAAGEAVVLTWTLDQLTPLRERLADLVQLAYLDGREDGQREQPPPPGMSAMGYRAQLVDLLDPTLDQLHAHALAVLARIHASGPAGPITDT